MLERYPGALGGPSWRRKQYLLEQLPNSRLVAIDPHLARHAALLAGEHRLRGSDSFYVALAHLAQQLGLSLVTWNREQAERGSAATPVITPGYE